FEIPLVRVGHGLQLFLRFRKREIERLLASGGTFQKELHSERRLADAGIPLHQVDSVLGQASRQDIIHPRYAGGGNRPPLAAHTSLFPSSFLEPRSRLSTP